MEKRKEFLVCIDSDGCVMDTMDLKHDKCLAPCMLMVWDLGKYKIELTARWREINLYSLDRGTNRFRGLAKMLKEVNENYKRSGRPGRLCSLGFHQRKSFQTRV